MHTQSMCRARRAIMALAQKKLSAQMVTPTCQQRCTSMAVTAAQATVVQVQAACGSTAARERRRTRTRAARTAAATMRTAMIFCRWSSAAEIQPMIPHVHAMVMSPLRVAFATVPHRSRCRRRCRCAARAARTRCSPFRDPRSPTWLGTSRGTSRRGSHTPCGHAVTVDGGLPPGGGEVGGVWWEGNTHGCVRGPSGPRMT